MATITHKKPRRRIGPFSIHVWISATGLLVVIGTLLLLVGPSEINYTGRRNIVEGDPPPHTSLSLPSKNNHNNIIRHGGLTCPEIKQKVVSGEWSDPNKGIIYAREVITEPHFRVALHNEEYDNTRWKTIMKEGKYYEDEVHARFVRILQDQPRSTVVDVGANIGYYTLLSLALGHDVVSFEPNPANLLRLCESLSLNDYFGRPTDGNSNSNNNLVQMFQNAVSETPGEMTLFVPKNPGQAFLKGLHEKVDADKDHQAKTKVVTLDSFAQEQGWFDRQNDDKDDFSITLLKIDVEGRDPLVILGAFRLLSSGLVKHVLTEGRRFGRPNLLEAYVKLFQAGFTLKEPVVALQGTTARDHAQNVTQYYLDKFGKNSMRTADLWWTRE